MMKQAFELRSNVRIKLLYVSKTDDYIFLILIIASLLLQLKQFIITDKIIFDFFIIFFILIIYINFLKFILIYFYCFLRARRALTECDSQ
jgi:hypothetical protein